MDDHRGATASSRRDRRMQQASIVVISLLVAVPYAVAGPGWFREDFVSLTNAEAGGAWAAAGPVVGENRPVTRVVYALVYGPLGEHPALVHALIVVSLTMVALLVHALLTPTFGGATGTLVAVVYLLSPSQSSIVHWPSALNIVLSSALLLAGMLLVQRDQRWMLSGALVGIAVLGYEAVLPGAVAGWCWFGWRERDWRGPVRALACTAPAVAWVLATTTNADPYPLRLGDGLKSLLGFGLTHVDPLWRVVMPAILVSIAVVGVWAIQGRFEDDRLPERLLLLGVAVVTCGYAPFVRFGFGMDFTGQGDRANFLAVLGVACILVGLGWRFTRALPLPQTGAGVVALVVFACLVLPTRVRNDHDWATVWDQTRSALDEAASDVRPDVSGETVAVPGCPTVVNGVQGVDTAYAATFALRWRTDDTDVLAACPGEG